MSKKAEKMHYVNVCKKKVFHVNVCKKSLLFSFFSSLKKMCYVNILTLFSLLRVHVNVCKLLGGELWKRKKNQLTFE